MKTAELIRDKMEDEDFYRIKRLPPYVFAEVNRMKAAARARGARRTRPR